MVLIISNVLLAHSVPKPVLAPSPKMSLLIAFVCNIFFAACPALLTSKKDFVAPAVSCLTTLSAVSICFVTTGAGVYPSSEGVAHLSVFSS